MENSNTENLPNWKRIAGFFINTFTLHGFIITNILLLKYKQTTIGGLICGYKFVPQDDDGVITEVFPMLVMASYIWSWWTYLFTLMYFAFKQIKYIKENNYSQSEKSANVIKVNTK